MTDLVPTPPQIEKPPHASKTFVKIVMLTGGLTMIISLIIMTLAPVAHWLVYPEIKLPEGMEKMASLALGFLFGTFSAMLKDYMGLD